MVDADTLATPVGFLPETSFGVPLHGTDTNNLTLPGGYDIFMPNVYTAKLVEGMRIKIGVNFYTVLTYTSIDPTHCKLTLDNPIVAGIPAGTPVLFCFIPFQHRLKTWEPEEDVNRDVWGGVGSGLIADRSTQAGRTANISWDGVKGRDIHKICAPSGPRYNLMSSMLAHLFTDDGELDYVDGDGNISIRASSNAPTVTFLWGIKTGEYRIATGCVFTSSEEDWPEGMDGLEGIKGEISSQKIDVIDDAMLAMFWLSPTPEPYRGPLMRAHGCTKIRFQHKTSFREPLLAGGSIVKVVNSRGFDNGDSIILVNELGFTESFSISLVNHTTREITLNIPTIRSYSDFTSWVQGVTKKSYRLKEFNLKNKSGQALFGDVSKPYDYRTGALADKLEIESSFSMRRDSFTPFYAHKGDASGTRLIIEIIEYEAPDQVGNAAAFYRLMEFAFTGNIKEPLTDEGKEVDDEFSMKLVRDRVHPNLIMQVINDAPPA